MKVVLIVLDSVGIGAAPDAADYGDEGSATLQHIGDTVGGLNLPTLQKLGLGNIPSLHPSIDPIPGIPPSKSPLASFGAMREQSEGKDTITGHWEICGLETCPGFHLFPASFPSFPYDIVKTLEQETGRSVIGNKAASGTSIIEELGKEHMATGAWIAYTSADSVVQLAAHVNIVPLDELYRGCAIARNLFDPLKVGRIIARPFTGKPGAFVRTKDRRDYPYTPSETLVTERLAAAGIPVHAVGKIEDIVAHRGIAESIHSGDNKASQEAVETFMQKPGDALVFANFIDFDMHFGHRRDPQGYATALQHTDRWLARFLPKLSHDDILILTADHGNDPTFKGTDHTREFVPLLVYRQGTEGQPLGIRFGFYDIAQSIATAFGLSPLPRGRNFLHNGPLLDKVAAGR